MKKLNYTKVIQLLSLFITTILCAQERYPIIEKEKKFELSGAADVYYRNNLNTKNDQNAVAPSTSFANGSGFSLGMLNIVGQYEGKKVGFTADLVFGPRANDAVFNSSSGNADDLTNTSAVINQLFMYWNITDNLSFTLGNFNTFLGYEVISPLENFNYSTSYMFSYGPFSHTGLKIDYQFSDDWSVIFSVMDPTDFTESNPYDLYVLGFSIGFKESTSLNILYGKDSETAVDYTFQIDLTSSLSLSESFYLGVNSTYKTTDNKGFYGVALYPQYGFNDTFSFGLRGEYFSEFNGGANALGSYDEEGNSDVIAVTLTSNHKIGSLMLKPEFRVDSGSENFFVDRDGKPSKALSSVLLAMVYNF